MKMSKALPPQWMETIVAGCGVLTIIMLSNLNTQTFATLTSVFVLGWFVQHFQQRRIVANMDATRFRPHSNTGLLLGNLLIPMVTTSTVVSTNSTSMSVMNIHHLSVMILCMLTPVAVHFSGLMHLKEASNYRFTDQLLILPILGLQVGSFWIGHHWMTSFLVTLTTIMSARFFFTRLMFFLPKSFSLGEAILVSQSLALLTQMAACSLTVGAGDLLACLQVLVLGCVPIGLAVFPVATNLHQRLGGNTPKDQSDDRIEIRETKRFHIKLSMIFYLCLTAVIILLLLPWLGFLLGQEPLRWGLAFVMATSTRMLLLCLWVVLVMGAVGMVMMLGSSSTITRKYFHLLAICIFVPGILYDVHLLHLASAGTFFVFIVLELLRIFRVWPLGGALHDAFKVFVDDQDCGVAILTHIYLLLGMSLPVWLYVETAGDSKPGVSLAIYSGVLSLGVGDSAASIVGSLYGRIKWPGSKKTLEGTCAAIVSQLLACCFLFYLDPHLTTHTSQGWLTITWVVSLTSVLEAVTTQIDNLVLPLFMYSLLINS